MSSYVGYDDVGGYKLALDLFYDILERWYKNGFSFSENLLFKLIMNESSNSFILVIVFQRLLISFPVYLFKEEDERRIVEFLK